MFKCNGRGALFKDLAPIKECLNGEVGYYIFHGCPNCRSDQVEIAMQCDLCGEYVTEDYVVLRDGTVACDDCHIKY